MFARFFARRRVRKASEAYRDALAAYRDADNRQDTRSMSIAAAELRAANNVLLSAELSLAKLDGFDGLRRIA